MTTIERVDYQEYIWSIKDTPDIKVITGIRRAGKSEIMKAFIKRLKSNDAAANVVYADLSVLENESLLEYHSLYNWAKEHHRPETKNYRCSTRCNCARVLSWQSTVCIVWGYTTFI